MMDFDDIWPHFSWVLDDMRDHGMVFFEGYIPILGQRELSAPLAALVDRAVSHTFMRSTWSNEADVSLWNQDHDTATYLSFFESRQILTLHFDYEACIGRTPLVLKLMFDRDDSRTALEIICYRDAILASSDPKQAVADAIAEFRNLKQLFRGDALLLGPDTVDVPTSATEFPQVWLRIE